MILSLPFLHPALLAAHTPGLVRCLDPGVLPGATANDDPRDAQRLWRPANLPLEPRQAAAMVADWLERAAQMGKPGDLSAWALRAAEGEGDFFSDSSMAISRDLLAAERGQSPASRPGAADPRLQAQLYLLLAWGMEERILEMVSLEDLLQGGQRRFFESLGMGDEDLAELAELGAAGPEAADASPLAELLGRWRATLRAMWTLVPDVRGFYVEAPEILTELAEMADISFVPADNGLLVASLAAETLLGPQAAGRELVILRPAP